MSGDRIDTDSLPFSIEKQKAVLGHILFDEKFFQTVVTKVEPEWFGDALLCRIYDALKKWNTRWGKPPTENELLDSQSITKLDAKEIVQIKNAVNAIKALRLQYDMKPLLDEMEVWLKARLIQTSLPKAAQAFNSQKLGDSVAILNKMVKDYHDIHFMEDGEVSFLNYGADLAKEQEDRSKALTFGVSVMDRLIEPNGTGGSMLPGHMTILLAPTNVGKTSALITISCANIMQGKSVLFMAHEGTPEELKNKFMRCISGMTNPEMLRAYLDPTLAKVMRNWELILQRFLTYRPMYKAGLMVEEVAVEVEKLQEKRRMLTGRGYDLLVDDYAAKLTCMANSRGNMQPRQIQEEVYNQFVQMGLRHMLHVLTAIQTNREGSKVNRKVGSMKNETRLLQMEDVMEAWGPMTAAAIVISLNRSDQDAALRKITYLLCKSRSGETGWAVVCNTDYDRCRIHSNDMGAFYYRGTESIGQKSAGLMEGFKGQLVTSEKLDLFEGNGV